MRKKLLFGLLFCVFLFTSCQSDIAPDVANHEKVKLFVYNTTKSYDYDTHPMRCWGNVRVYDSNKPRPKEEENRKQEIGDFEKPQHVTLMNWYYNESVSGDSYEGYFFIYRVDLQYPWMEESVTYYAIVNLVLFDDDSCEYKVEYISESLADCESVLDS